MAFTTENGALWILYEVATADVWSGDCIIAISTLFEFFKDSQHVAKANL
jgi:hypothetical protein